MKTTTKKNSVKKVSIENEISVKYFETNLKRIQNIFQNRIYLSDNKILEIANIISDITSIFESYELGIENFENKEISSNCREVRKNYKLELINKIVNF